MGNGPSLPIVVMGTVGSGKTALTYSIVNKELFGDTEASSNALQTSSTQHKEIPLNIIDIGGRYPREQTIDALKQADGIIFVVDATDKDSLPMAAWELYVTGRLARPKAPIMVLINSKISTKAVSFEELFPLFTKDSLPPVDISSNSGDLELTEFTKEKTDHGFLIDQEKLTTPLREFHTGPWNVAPIDNFNDPDQIRKVLDWITLNMPPTGYYS